MAVSSIAQPGRRPALDDLDKAIIRCLQQDGRRPYAQIGRELKVPEATVRQRAERLISRRVVQVVGVTVRQFAAFQAPCSRVPATQEPSARATNARPKFDFFERIFVQFCPASVER